jgi:hypothetical protein
MKKITANIGRGFRSVVKNKPRPKQAKLRQLREEIEESQLSPLQSPFSEASQVSPRATPSTAGDESLIEDTPENEVVDSASQAAAPSLTEDFVEDDNNSPVLSQAYDETDGPEPEEDRVNDQSMEDEADHDSQSTFVDAQAMRDLQYLRFNGEDEWDYTEGPVRIVDANEGAKDCAALLLNLDFSGRIQRALRAQREFLKEERQLYGHMEKSTAFEWKIQLEISSHSSKILDLEQVNGTEDQRASLEDERSTLEAMLENSKNEGELRQTRLNEMATNLRAIQTEVNAYLEEAMVHACFFEPPSDEPDTPIPEMDLQEEFQKFRAERDREKGIFDEEPATLDTSRQHLEAPPLDPEDQAKLELGQAYWKAHQNLQGAQWAFDRRVQTREEEFQANREAALRGEEPMDASREGFDARWVIRIQELTRELIEAEAALEQAKYAAVEGGADIGGDDQMSCFLDDVDDGYTLSFEQDMIIGAPEQQIHDWLADVPEDAGPDTNDSPEIDDWHMREVEWSDSVSMLEWDSEKRKRIDKWETIAGLRRLSHDRRMFAASNIF